MNSEQVLSLDQFLGKADKVLRKLKQSHRPIILTQNEVPVAVLHHVESYNKLLKAVVMIKLLLQGEKDVQQGRVREQSQVFEEIERMLESGIG